MMFKCQCDYDVAEFLPLFEGPFEALLQSRV